MHLRHGSAQDQYSLLNYHMAPKKSAVILPLVILMLVVSSEAGEIAIYWGKNGNERTLGYKWHWKPSIWDLSIPS